MKVVIEISESQFADIQRIASVQLKNRLPTAEQIIASGTPIKKGEWCGADMREGEADG